MQSSISLDHTYTNKTFFNLLSVIPLFPVIVGRIPRRIAPCVYFVCLCHCVNLCWLRTTKWVWVSGQINTTYQNWRTCAGWNNATGPVQCSEQQYYAYIQRCSVWNCGHLEVLEWKCGASNGLLTQKYIYCGILVTKNCSGYQPRKRNGAARFVAWWRICVSQFQSMRVFIRYRALHCMVVYHGWCLKQLPHCN